MLEKFFRKKEAKKEEPENEPGFFSTDFNIGQGGVKARYRAMEIAFKKTFQVMPEAVTAIGMDGKVAAMDGSMSSLKATFAAYNSGIPAAQFGWYAGQGFIGYQNCAMLSQNWLIDKACTMPARDAIRVGYDITVNDGTEISPDALDLMKKIDKEMRLNQNCEEFVGMGRKFGIRIAMFKVDSSDPDYYLKPFNPDGVMPGSYKGISQIDPYWITPELDASSAGDPSAINFYEPTWWRVNGTRIHRTHLVIMRPSPVPDILKPSYLYGGISIPQKIYERVYAAERTANEAPMLAMTKRLNVQKIDIGEAFANQLSFEQRIQYQNELRDNYGKLFIGLDEEATQLETSLTDLDAVIMTQFQIVAAAANVPATKLLGTTPKGFNSTGDYEEASYHEELETIQTNDLTPLIERHHLLVVRSIIAPKFGITPFGTSVAWGSLDAMTAKEKAEVNLIKAQTGVQYVNAGAIDGADERARIISDPDSGYNGISDEPIEVEPEPGDDEAQ